ncbi:MAG TPA: TetR/AcrR family transcriptional regulator [Pseudonocardiaceae bacterium]|nr:TetR/AcrR family transcriptional regulator [Pseudonocardiaceae bacterium]
MEARERILVAAAELLAEGDGEAVSTRAICNRADVGPPTLYHHFGDKDGLFDAVVAQRFAEFLTAARAVSGSGDPVEDLRRGWEFHVDFGRRNPAFYVLMYAQPKGDRKPRAAQDARADLVALLQDVAGAGRLRGDVGPAADTIEAALVGATLHAINNHAINNAEVPRVADAVRDAVFAAVLTDVEPASETPTLARIATQFGALIARADNPLTNGERVLLAEWVERLSQHG